LPKDNKKDWTPEAMEQLRTLWESDIPRKEIEKIFGVSKNSTIGKAHRMNLTPRRPKGNPTMTLMALRVCVAQRVVKKSPALPSKASLTAPSTGCMWPFGDPKEPGFRYCGDPLERGGVYCEVHREKAYVRRVG
jgi:GcrA cell cycle regulator